ncbi:MAG: M6 family metalloprotease domain-containing protein [Dysgonamonadaceae bacterium]|jgi:M6 family metalloprotease-like protein|nr:M6 family metalloprotease domain-containing protein [Dysgonamonadaceae bacterium]
MQKYKKLLTAIGFFILFAQSAFPVPAYPYFSTITQPDGKIITVKMKGDEHIKWMESEDGYSLLYDKEHYVVYATLDENGDMTPSNLRVSTKNTRTPEINDQLKKIPKGLQYSGKQKQMLRQIRQMKEESIARTSQPSFRSAVGHAKAICTLIQFKDKSFTRTLEEFEALMNQEGYNANGAKGSVRDFYLENSYGQLILEVTVAGIHTSLKNHAYYGENGSNNYDLHPEELAKEAAEYTFDQIDPADFDNDGDGYIDTFHFIYAGYGEESSGGQNCIWAHKSGFYPALTFSGKKLNTYSCSPELRGNSGSNITFIGPICHELCHVFGAPDFYDVDGEDNSGNEFSGTGQWDLMAGGSWNGSVNGKGSRPAHINMYQKIAFGWVNPVELTATQTITGMPNSAENPVAYIIKTPRPDEYFVLENRQKRGFDTNVPGNGLLIYHVSITQQDINRNTVNDKHPQKVYPVYAASTVELPTGTPDSYGLINSASCPFPGTKSKKIFNQTSTPALKTWNNDPMTKSITGITEANRLISFQFTLNLLNVTASVSGKKVTLNWDIPNVANLKGYNVYRDNTLILTTTENLYRDTVKENGVYTYGVSFLFENSESEKEEITVSVVAAAVNAIEKNPIRIYPNPIEKGNRLIIEDSDCSKADLLFYNLAGQLIMQKQISSSYSQYTMNLPSGLYLLKIIKEHKTETIKLIVK